MDWHIRPSVRPSRSDQCSVKAWLNRSFKSGFKKKQTENHRWELFVAVSRRARITISMMIGVCVCAWLGSWHVVHAGVLRRYRYLGSRHRRRTYHLLLLRLSHVSTHTHTQSALSPPSYAIPSLRRLFASLSVCLSVSLWAVYLSKLRTYFIEIFSLDSIPSMLWRCWFWWQEGHPACKNLAPAIHERFFDWRPVGNAAL